MRGRLKKYLCLEDSCKHQQAMSWTPFLKHQRTEHHRQWSVHVKSFTSTAEFQVWFKFVQEIILRLPALRETGNTFHSFCQASDTTDCPARIIATMKTSNNAVSILVIYMGEHYGHDHFSNREERLFLLDYSIFASSPLEIWSLYFRHAGVFLQTESTPVLRKKAQDLALKSESLIVVGFMNNRQIQILQEFQSTIYLEDHGNWIVMYSLVMQDDAYSKPPMALPVAYCYSNFMDQTIIVEFFNEIRNLSGCLDCNNILSNNQEVFQYPWNTTLPEGECSSMQSWQSAVTKVCSLLPSSSSYFEVLELGEILRNSICKNYPSFLNILTDFVEAAKFSQKLHANIVENLLEHKNLECLSELIGDWINELKAHEWIQSFHERLFVLDSFFIHRTIMSDDNLAKVLMQLTLFSNHVLNTSPPLEELGDFVFSEELKDYCT